jgi:hypothetical protein
MDWLRFLQITSMLLSVVLSSLSLPAEEASAQAGGAVPNKKT